MNWWIRFKNWLTGSKPLGVREQLESWLESNPQVFAQIHADQVSKREPRGGFRQLRRQDKFLADLPASTDFAIDVYEAPVPGSKDTVFGYTMSFFATEADGSEWQLTYEPDAEKMSPQWTKIGPTSLA